MISANLAAIFYLVSGILFILALRGLSSPDTSRQGNYFGIAGMIIAIVVTFLSIGNFSTSLVYVIIFLVIGGAVGAFIAFKIPMTAMPELVAGFHSLVGLAAVFVAIAAFLNPAAFNLGNIGNIKLASLIEMSIGAAVGAITFSGSIIAFLKLRGIMSGAPITFSGQHILNLIFGIGIFVLIFYLCKTQSTNIFWTVIILSFLVGVLLIIPIGGADMPVVISMLNSYSGWAAAGIGFTLENTALIITGALVGSSGAILSYIMCKAMNRSFVSVILGGFGAESSTDDKKEKKDQKPVKSGNAEDAAFLMKNASSVIIVPGYGMAVAQAQHALREMVDKLKKNDIKVTYAIHPVAGRMPGHMNVLLAEANVPYDEVFELEDINNDFANSDVAFVIGANDVTNPVAKTDPKSPIFGMPVLDVEKCKSVLFVKRSLSPGYAGIDNELFYKDNTLMLFADAKKMTEEIVKKFRLMKTKIFCDIADFKTIKFFNNKTFVDGFTTNPSLMRLAGAKNYKQYLKILKVCKKPISFEVFADNFKDMLKQAYEINSWGKNVYVKIPVVNSKGIFTGPVIKELSDEGIKLNITAVYTFEQTKIIYKNLNKKTKSIISIFAGRMADKGKDPLPIFRKSISMTKKIKILTFYGLALEKLIIIFKLNKLNVI